MIFIKRFFLFILGILLGFILLETLLQTCSFVYSISKDISNNAVLGGSKNYKILCLGESTTEGQYPKFLEETLNSSVKDIRFAVIDKGRMAVNTDLILINLNFYLTKYNPDMVITMMGVNDRRMDMEVFENVPGRFYTKLRSFKLIKLIIFHIKAKILNHKLSINKSADNINLSNKDNMSPEVHMKGFIYLENARKFLLKNDYDNAEVFYIKLIELTPKIEWLYKELALLYCYQNKNDKAIAVYLKGIEANPESDFLYFSLANLYRALGKYDEASDMYMKSVGKNLKLDNFEFETFFSSFSVKSLDHNLNDLKYYQPVTQYNYKKLRDALKKIGIKHVCVEYPTREIGPLKEMLGNDPDIIFVDNEKIFRDAVSKDGYDAYFRDRFCGDWGHCTDRGNELLAKNIADAVIKSLNLKHK